MQSIFITKIHIKKVRHLENVEIRLSDTERKHLILTGKNGSGKTSLLQAMSDYVLCQQYVSSREQKDTYGMWSKHNDKLDRLYNKKENPGVAISYGSTSSRKRMFNLLRQDRVKASVSTLV